MFKKIIEKIDDFLVYIGWYKFLRFIENWIFPAYFLRNLFFYRYDRVVVPQIKAYEYSDKEYLMLCAVMQIIVDFIEKENPEKHICWYKSEDGEDLGHKYGENINFEMLFPEYKDKYIMDIIKDIYHFWTVIYPKKVECKEYLLNYWSKYLCGDLVEQPVYKDVFNVTFDAANAPKTKEDLYKLNLDWVKLDYVIDIRADLLDSECIRRKIWDLENEIVRDCQKYLHLAIEVRPYLWT